MKEEGKKKLRDAGFSEEAIVEIEADENMVAVEPKRYAELLRREELLRSMWRLTVQIEVEMEE